MNNSLKKTTWILSLLWIGISIRNLTYDKAGNVQRILDFVWGMITAALFIQWIKFIDYNKRIKQPG
ncbi:MAG: hypothetical protein J0I09_04465 [Sphingobacteriia bacterium]|nr:hypothetical protein [Sphingobacteriia bacterium]